MKSIKARCNVTIKPTGNKEIDTLLFIDNLFKDLTKKQQQLVLSHMFKKYEEFFQQDDSVYTCTICGFTHDMCKGHNITYNINNGKNS